MKKSLVKFVSCTLLSSNELCVLSLQMSSGSLMAHWQTRPGWQTLVWCPCRTPLLVSTGHILWMQRGLLKVQASVVYKKWFVVEKPYSQRSTVLTYLACFVIINSLLTVMEWTTTGYFFHKDSTDPLTLWIFLYQTNVVKCLHACLSNSIQQHVVFQHTNLSYQLVQHYQALA